MTGSAEWPRGVASEPSLKPRCCRLLVELFECGRVALGLVRTVLSPAADQCCMLEESCTQFFFLNLPYSEVGVLSFLLLTFTVGVLDVTNYCIVLFLCLHSPSSCSPTSPASICILLSCVKQLLFVILSLFLNRFRWFIQVLN